MPTGFFYNYFFFDPQHDFFAAGFFAATFLAAAFLAGTFFFAVAIVFFFFN